MNDSQMPESGEDQDKLLKRPATPRTVHKSNADEKPDPEEDEDHGTATPEKP